MFHLIMMIILIIIVTTIVIVIIITQGPAGGPRLPADVHAVRLALGRPRSAAVRGNHWSNTTCLTQVSRGTTCLTLYYYCYY